MYKYLQLKNQADLRKPCFYQNSGGFTESLRLQKTRRIYRILAITKKQADLQNPHAYRKSGGQ
jgi:hypothetical protein